MQGTGERAPPLLCTLRQPHLPPPALHAAAAAAAAAATEEMEEEEEEKEEGKATGAEEGKAGRGGSML